MSIYSQIFQASVSGNGQEAEALERERIQLVKQGATGFMPSGVGEETNPHARREKEKKDAAAQRDTAILQASMELAQAFESLNQTKREFDDRMDELDDRIEARIEAIDAKLNDPNGGLDEEKRKALEEERLRLITIQQHAHDERERIQAKHDDLQRRRDAGEEIDPKEVRDLEEDLNSTLQTLEHEFDSASQFTAEQEAVKPTIATGSNNMSVSTPTF